MESLHTNFSFWGVTRHQIVLNLHALIKTTLVILYKDTCPVVGYIREQSGLQAVVLRAGQMGQCKNLSDFDVGQIVMARRYGQSIFKLAGLVGCSWYAVVLSTYQK